ncbi:Beta-1,2-xylosyltransferase 1 [Cytospora mali]|uniref:Beta-1,2-xylosyltransferase 1 n=1 Tax=Cytospora mali TaxID=578113 RepID=A0A194W2D9_CYTMA|nr:Beta-1,2-xylosyltransferase 1 [Valsa mali]
MKGQFQFSEMYGVDPLYFFDVFTDGIIFTTLFISLSLFTCQSSPLVSTGIITLVCGALAAKHKLGLLGTYEQLDSWVVLPIWTLCIGFVIFMFRNQTRVILSPGWISFLILVTIIGTSVFSLVTGGVELDQHPLDKITSEIRTIHQRWHTQATTSGSLKVAVDEYRERHHGRNPPRGFSEWYDYTVHRSSPIIDYFQQIEDDILPFLGMKPSKIREDISKIGTNRDISLLSIKKGTATHQPTGDLSNDALMDNLIQLIQPFVQHLSDMDLPINLLDRPRVLASWSDKTRFQQAALAKKFDLLTNGLNKRDESSETEIKPDDEVVKDAKLIHDKLQDRQLATSWEHQRQLGQACAPNSPTRWGFYANNRDFCSACANPQAEGQYVQNWTQAQDICHQPDMFNLHGFYMADLPLQPFAELVPVFGRAKTDRFSDILIPLSPNDEIYDTHSEDKNFVSKSSNLFWRGEAGTDFGMVSSRLLSGGHQERLSHIANNASATESVIMCLAVPGDKERFRYERVPLLEANSALKFDAGMSDYSICDGPGCDAAKTEFGFKPRDKDDAVKMNSRYIMIMDSDEGPPHDLLKVLRSNSIPLVASVFKEWYTERLFPWLHFIPIDLRFHGLHSTLAFFTGLQGKGLINGRNVAMTGDIEGAQMISQEGKSWANKAIRREDAEIYLFRLLIEWGRVVSDKRDEMDFILPAHLEKGKEAWNA